MPGLNRQGPDGRGPMTGKRQGMCRRTDSLDLPDDLAAGGRGMGRRSRGFGFRAPHNPSRSGNMGRGFTTGEADQLAKLKEEYQKTQDALASLLKKIEGLEER